MNDNTETELERKLHAEMDQELEEAVDAPDSSEAVPEDDSAPDETDAIDPVAALEAETEDLKDQLLRARAEFDNYRKRTAREVERIRRTAAESVIHELLPVMDNLELALNHANSSDDPLVDGVRMVLKQMLEVLERSGLEPIEAQGQPFDPAVHEAVSQMESAEVAEGKVAEQFQRGYKLGGQILRPSKVVVSLGTGEAGNAD